MALTIKKAEKDSPADTKATKPQSGISHPYFDLEAGIRVAELVYGKGGGVASPAQLAAWLDYASIKSGTYLTRIAAAKHFGLIDTINGNFSVTERAKKILAPVMPSDSIQAKIDAFEGVPLFAKVFAQFDGGKLPPVVGLENLFRDSFKIVPDRVNPAVRIFMRSAAQAGYFSEGDDRLVRPSAGRRPDRIDVPSSDQNAVTDVVLLPPPDRRKSNGGGSGSGGGEGIHDAIIGLLRDLPSPGSVWSTAKKKRFLDAFVSTINHIYPEDDDV